jgi:hypothetical protein
MSTANQSSMPTPPRGYSSWLDYAVATMDVRAAQLDALDPPDDEAEGVAVSYDAMRGASKNELAALRGEHAALRELLREACATLGGNLTINALGMAWYEKAVDALNPNRAPVN